jgi:predicted Zn-dependent protease
MGHEIAHAVAKHSIERASRALLLNVGTKIVDIASGGKISSASRAVGIDVAGILRTIGIDNPFGRKQETEADYLGLIFSSLAGYDIRESVKIWERMKESYKGKEPPEWMSTHPSSDTRIESLRKWLPEIIMNYPPIKKIG